MILRGVAVCPGIAVGRVVIAGREIPTLHAAGTPEEERQKLDRAITLARQQLAHAPAQRQWLDEQDLTEFCWELVASGTAAVTAWHRAFSRVAERLADSPGELFARRAEDVREAGRHVLRLLATGNGVDGAPSDAIVIARALAPADLSSLDAVSMRGICTVSDVTEHVAAFARSYGIPAVAGADARVLDLAAGSRVVLDGGRGHVIVGPQSGSGGDSLFSRLASHLTAPFLPPTRRR